MFTNETATGETRAWQLINRLGIDPSELDYLSHLVRHYPALSINEAETQTIDFKDSVRNPVAYFTAALRKRSQ